MRVFDSALLTKLELNSCLSSPAGCAGGRRTLHRHHGTWALPNNDVIVMPHVYEKYRQVVLEPRFIRVTGMVQNQDGIVHLKAEYVETLKVSAAQVASHDFH